MLLRMINALTCEISPQQIGLLRGNERLNSIQRQPEQPLEADLLTLLKPFRGRLPWCHTITFQLDASLVHHLIAPWQAGISTPGELCNYSAMLAQKNFPQSKGKSLKIGFEDYAYGRNALVLALEEEQWQTLLQVTQQLKLRFLGVITPLHSLLGTWRNGLPDDGIFALPGEQSSTFACRFAGEWQQIYRLSLPDLHASQQVSLMARLTGIRDASCYIWDREQGRMTQKLHM